ncbi:MAG: tetratricopeptide repeat protein [Gammaproteobacteria bacterium]|nr:tetratricopeptide repeat protein [Gammaproteobacteria bacterium]
MSQSANSHARVLQDAIEAHKGGRLLEAEAAYRSVLQVRPDDPDALNFFGMLRCQTGHQSEAAEFLRRSVEVDPKNPHAWLNLGNVLVMLNRDEEARTAFTRATELAPDLAMAWFNLGVCLGRCKQPLEAASALHRALKIEPGHLPAYESLAVVLHRLGNYEEAAEVFREWLAHDPDNAMARHMLAATSGAETPSRAADQYVRVLFDDFAATFDENLASLEYRAPQLIAERLTREARGDAPLDILDAGCGTGLCGPLVREVARRLAGVDLSAAMVEKARARGCYDELLVEELCAFMSSRPAAFDVVLSADTLVYFGALEEPLRAARRCLREDGLLIFTVERLNEEQDSGARQRSYRLETHGRYSHCERYVGAALAGAGFGGICIEKGVLRRERGSEVSGLIVLGRAA